MFNKSQYKAPERRRSALSEEDMDAIAARVVEKTIERMTEKMYREIGRTVVTKLLVAVGAGVVGFYFYAKNHGWTN